MVKYGASKRTAEPETRNQKPERYGGNCRISESSLQAEIADFILCDDRSGVATIVHEQTFVHGRNASFADVEGRNKSNYKNH